MGNLKIRHGEDLTFRVLDDAAAGEPLVIAIPASGEEPACAAKAIGAIEEDDDEAARGRALRAIGFRSDERRFFHRSGEAWSGGRGLAGFNAEDALFSDELVGIRDQVRLACDVDGAGFLADKKRESGSAHGIDRELCHIGSGRVAFLFREFEAVWIEEASVAHTKNAGEFIHFLDERPDGIFFASAALIHIAADMICDGHGGVIVRAEEGCVEGIRQIDLLAGLEVHGVGAADAGDGFWDRGGDFFQILFCGNGPVRGDHAGGDFRQTGDGSFGRGILSKENLARVSFDNHVGFLSVGGEAEQRERQNPASEKLIHGMNRLEQQKRCAMLKRGFCALRARGDGAALVHDHFIRHRQRAFAF